MLHETDNKHHVRFITHDTFQSDLQLRHSFLLSTTKALSKCRVQYALIISAAFMSLKIKPVKVAQSVPSSQLDTAIFSIHNCLVAILSYTMILHYDLFLKGRRKQNLPVVELCNNTASQRIYFSFSFCSTSWVPMAKTLFVHHLCSLAECTRTNTYMTRAQNTTKEVSD